MASASVPTLEIPRAPRTVRRWCGVPTVPPVLVAAALVYPLVANDYWTFNLTYAFTFGIACLGLYVLTGWAGQISLAQAGLVGTALYVTDYAERGTRGPGDLGLGLPFVAAIGVGLAAVVMISAIVGLVCARLPPAYPVVLTFSVQFLLEATIFTRERFSGGFNDGPGFRRTLVGIDLNADDDFYWFVVGVLALTLVVLYRLRGSRHGRGMVSLGVDPEAAAACGLPVWRYRVGAFCIAGALAGIAGGLEGPLFRNPPGPLQFTAFNSLVFVAVPALAGCESATFVVVVATALALTPQILLTWHLNVFLLGGGAAAIGVMLGPRGLGGRLADLADGRRWRRG
jgi:branched-chain amino acid transport system permease protein